MSHVTGQQLTENLEKDLYFVPKENHNTISRTVGSIVHEVRQDSFKGWNAPSLRHI